jgi:hypothetical protein
MCESQATMVHQLMIIIRRIGQMVIKDVVHFFKMSPVKKGWGVRLSLILQADKN